MSPSARVGAVAALLAALLLGPAAPAVAAGGAAPGARKASPPAAAPAPEMVFDDITLELTNERLDAILRGLAAGHAAAPGRADVLARQRSLEQQAGTIRAAHGPEIARARQARATVLANLAAGYAAVIARRQRELAAREQQDAALKQQMDIYAMELAQAQVKGDTAEVKRLGAPLAALTAPSHAESLAVQAQWGPAPPEDSLSVRLGECERQAGAAAAELHALDARAIAAGVQASGLEEIAYRKALERIASYLALAPATPAPAGFGADELSALAAHRAALAAALATP